VATGKPDHKLERYRQNTSGNEGGLLGLGLSGLQSNGTRFPGVPSETFVQFADSSDPGRSSYGTRPKNGCLTCYYTNPTSLGNKMSELNSLAGSLKPHIISISETWFSESSCTHLFGYTLYSSNRNGYGGVAIYVSNQVESTEINTPELCSKSIEQVWCVVKVGNDKILCG